MLASSTKLWTRPQRGVLAGDFSRIEMLTARALKLHWVYLLIVPRANPEGGSRESGVLPLHKTTAYLFLEGDARGNLGSRAQCKWISLR